MSKKDRVAIVVSILWLFITITLGVEEGALLYGIVSGLLPIIIYWGYKFVRDDISFLGKFDNNKK